MQSLRTTHICSRRSTDDVTLINFQFSFWSRGHLRVVVLHDASFFNQILILCIDPVRIY